MKFGLHVCLHSPYFYLVSPPINWVSCPSLGGRGSLCSDLGSWGGATGGGNHSGERVALGTEVPEGTTLLRPFAFNRDLLEARCLQAGDSDCL
jgi:hypothetical protein